MTSNFVKRIILLSIFLSLASASFAQANNKGINNSSTENSIETSSEKKSLSIFPYFNLGTNITLNIASKEKSAPTPINFYIGGGAIFNITQLVSIEPKLDFWTMYYLFDGNDALPAEVEHRTATVLCFMLDVPVGFNFRKGAHTFTPGAGLGFLMRFAFLSNGVKDNDKGSTGSAKSDADKIAAWCWSNARFLYPEIFFNWDYKISEKFKAGLCAKIYFPFGSIISGHGLDGTIFNLTTRFIF